MTTFGALSAQANTRLASFRNVANGPVSFVAGGQTYTVAVNAIVTVPDTAAKTSTDITSLLLSGSFIELVVYGSSASVVPIVPASSQAVTAIAPTFTAATASSITGNFDGVGIDPASGRWILDDGNRIIYPNSRLRQQPAAGSTSVVTLGATMQRTSIAGSVGFALYTDADITGNTFANGIAVLFSSTGLCEISRVQNGTWNDITDRTTQRAYPLDLNEHTFALVVTYVDSAHLTIFAYADGVTVSRATVTSGIVSNGTVGFATAAGAGPVLVAPGSFVFTLGTDIFETTSAVTQQVIGNESGTASLAIPSSVSGTLAQGNTDPAVVAGAVSGTNKNMVPDSDYKFGNTYCITSQAGIMSIQPGVGVSGGNGVVLTSPAGGGVVGRFYYMFDPINSVVPGSQWTLSGNILATGTMLGGTGLAAWEVWDGEFTQRIAAASQNLGLPLLPNAGTRRVQETFIVPVGITSLIVTVATNNVALGAGSSIVWSEPKLETGPYATAYTAGLFSESSSTLPIGVAPTELQSVVTSDGSGGGLLLLALADPSSTAPFVVMPGQIASTIATESGAQNTFLINQTVNNGSVSPGAITNSLTSPTFYTNETANSYANLVGNFHWYLLGTGPIDSTTEIVDGSTLVYVSVSADAAAAPAAAPELLTIAPNATLTVVWSHPAFVGTSIGSTNVDFTGNQYGATTNILAASSIADTSSPNITGVQSTVTQTTPFSASVSNNGNPSIIQTQSGQSTQTPETLAISDAQATGINAANIPVTINEPFTATANEASSPQVVRTDQTTQGPLPQSQAYTNYSTPTITGQSVTKPTIVPVAGTPTAIASDPTAVVTGQGSGPVTTQIFGPSTPYASTATIQQTASTVYSDQPQVGAVDYFAGTADLVVTPHVGQQLVQHSSPYLADGNAPAAQIVANNVDSPVVTPWASVGAWGMGIATTNTTTSSPAGCVLTTYGFTPCRNANITARGTFRTAATTYADPAHPNVLNINLPSSFSVQIGETGAVQLEKVQPPPQPPIYYCSPVNTLKTVSYAINWTVQLLGPNGALLATWANQIGNVQLSWGSPGTPPIGVYEWVVWPQFVTDTGVNETPTGVQVSVVNATVSYDSRSVSYLSFNGGYVPLGTFTSNVPPTSPGTAITLHIGNVGEVAGAYGYFVSEVIVQINDGTGNGKFVIDVVRPTANTNYTYYASGETHTSYTIIARSVVLLNYNTGAEAASPVFDGYYYYWNNDPVTTYTYAVTPGTPTTIATSGITDPTAPQSLILSNLTLPSDANGTAELVVALTSPTGNTVSYTVVNAATTISLANVPGTQGSYTWSVTPTVVQTGNPTATVAYPCAGYIQATWSDLVGTTTYTYKIVPGSISNLVSDATKQAPISGATQIGLVVSAASFPSDSNGASNALVTLHDPSGTALGFTCNGAAVGAGGATIAGNATLSYFHAGAAAGNYTWSIVATCTANNSGAGSYPVSLTAVASSYATVVGQGYSYGVINGTMTPFTTSSSAVAPINTATQLTLNLASMVLSADAHATTAFSIALFDPNGSAVYNWNVLSPQTTTLSYWNASAIQGAYRWQIYAYVIPNDTGTVTQIYNCAAAVTPAWYEIHNVTTTIYTSNTPTAQPYFTASQTVAPTTAALALSLTIGTITCGSDAYGASSYQVLLLAPNGTQLQSWTTTTLQTLSYFNAAAVAGSYQWQVTAFCTNNGTGTSSYSDSLSFTLGWYTNQSIIKTTYSTIAGALSTAVTDTATVAPTSPATQLSLSIASLLAESDSNGTSSWTITLTDSKSNVVKTWTGLTTAETLTWSGPAAVGGRYTWSFQSVVVLSSNPSASATYSNALSSTLGWFDAVTTINPNFSPYPGPGVTYVTDVTTSAPTSVQTQLTLTVSALTLPASAAGNTEYTVTLQNAVGSLCAAWVLTNLSQSPLSYWNAAAVAGAYTWTLQAVTTMSATPAAETWETGLTGTLGWFKTTVISVGTYTNVQSTTTSTAQTGTGTLAPINSSVALTLNATSLTLPSNVDGATQYQVTLKDPSGNVVLSELLTTLGIVQYYNSAAVGGQYTWNLYAVCTNTGVGPSIFSTAFSGTIGWYQSVTGPVTTYTVHDGAAATYTMPANTVAPQAAGTALTLTLSQVSAPADSFGTSSVAVLLYDPSGTIVAAATTTGITAPRTIAYYDPAAIDGAYTWLVYGKCVSNQSGSSAYAVSWAGSTQSFEPSPTNECVYVLANDGVTQRCSVADSNVKFTTLSMTQAIFKITNSASAPLNFTLGVLSKGF